MTPSKPRSANLKAETPEQRAERVIFYYQIDGGGDMKILHRMIAEAIAAALRDAREKARAEDCRLVCKFCDAQEPVELLHERWAHVARDKNGKLTWAVDCIAAPIRAPLSPIGEAWARPVQYVAGSEPKGKVTDAVTTAESGEKE